MCCILLDDLYIYGSKNLAKKEIQNYEKNSISLVTVIFNQMSAK